MPSAANVKIDNKVSPESALPDSSSAATPLRQVITLVEHKIRNLEKRKVSHTGPRSGTELRRVHHDFAIEAVAFTLSLLSVEVRVVPGPAERRQGAQRRPEDCRS
jgi:hypothetical protein